MKRRGLLKGVAGVLAAFAGAEARAMAQTRSIPADAIWVAEGNDDAGSGRRDQPVGSVAAAVARARKAKSRTVVLRAGFHELAETLRLTSTDSGLTILSAPGETATLSGGVRLNGWKETAPGRFETRAPFDFDQLYVNESRRYRPRLPESGYFTIAGDAPSSSAAGEKGFDQFVANPGEIDPKWANFSDVEVLPFHIWTMSRFKIASFDAATNLVRVAGHTSGKDGWARMPRGNRYLVENVKEVHRKPKTWYLDRPTRTVAYLSTAAEMRNARVVAPKIAELLVIDGAKDITIRGVTFADSSYLLPENGSSYPQADIHVASAVTLRGCRNVTLENCVIRNTGGYGVAIGLGSKDCALRRCDLLDLGAGGVKIGETDNPADPEKRTERITVADCRLIQGGRIHPAGVAIWIGHSSGNRILHNEIADFYYTGISPGWSWGYGESGCHHNEIAFNHIHRIGQGVLSDMGGIYTLGVSPGTTLHHNHIHDIDSFGYGGWGIYFDEGSTGVIAENNLVYETKSAPFHQHYGRENIVRNNILAFGREAQLMRTRPENHLSFTIERNVVLFREGPLLGSNWSGTTENFLLRNNLYFQSAGKSFDFAGKSLVDWQKTGQDIGSIVADPLLVEPEKGDFSLRSDESVRRIGFVPFSVKTAGPRGAGKLLLSNVRAFPPPPPPAPPRPIADDFEAGVLGSSPVDGFVIQESAVPAARIVTTDETASRGKRSLKFTDARGQKASSIRICTTPRTSVRARL